MSRRGRNPRGSRLKLDLPQAEPQTTTTTHPYDMQMDTDEELVNAPVRPRGPKGKVNLDTAQYEALRSKKAEEDKLLSESGCDPDLDGEERQQMLMVLRLSRGHDPETAGVRAKAEDRLQPSSHNEDNIEPETVNLEDKEAPNPAEENIGDSGSDTKPGHGSDEEVAPVNLARQKGHIVVPARDETNLTKLKENLKFQGHKTLHTPQVINFSEDSGEEFSGKETAGIGPKQTGQSSVNSSSDERSTRSRSSKNVLQVSDSELKSDIEVTDSREKLLKSKLSRRKPIDSKAQDSEPKLNALRVQNKSVSKAAQVQKDETTDSDDLDQSVISRNVRKMQEIGKKEHIGRTSARGKNRKEKVEVVAVPNLERKREESQDSSSSDEGLRQFSSIKQKVLAHAKNIIDDIVDVSSGTDSTESHPIPRKESLKPRKGNLQSSVVGKENEGVQEDEQKDVKACESVEEVCSDGSAVFDSTKAKDVGKEDEAMDFDDDETQDPDDLSGSQDMFESATPPCGQFSNMSKEEGENEDMDLDEKEADKSHVSQSDLDETLTLKLPSSPEKSPKKEKEEGNPLEGSRIDKKISYETQPFEPSEDLDLGTDEREAEMHKQLPRKRKSEGEEYPMPAKIPPQVLTPSPDVTPKKLVNRKRLQRKLFDKRPYFAPPNVDPKQYTKVIQNYFEQYRVLLRESQAQALHSIPYGNPVVAGKHVPNSLDIQRRVKKSVYDLGSDEEDDVPRSSRGRRLGMASRPVEKKLDSSYTKQTFLGNHGSEEKSDGFLSLTQGRRPTRAAGKRGVMPESVEPFSASPDGLPDLVVESESSKTHPNKGSLRTIPSSSPQDIFEADTQDYDPPNSEAGDFNLGIGSFYGKAKTTTPTSSKGKGFLSNQESPLKTSSRKSEESSQNSHGVRIVDLDEDSHEANLLEKSIPDLDEASQKQSEVALLGNKVRGNREVSDGKKTFVRHDQEMVSDESGSRSPVIGSNQKSLKSVRKSARRQSRNKGSLCDSQEDEDEPKVKHVDCAEDSPPFRLTGQSTLDTENTIDSDVSEDCDHKKTRKLQRQKSSRKKTAIKKILDTDSQEDSSNYDDYYADKEKHSKSKRGVSKLADQTRASESEKSKSSDSYHGPGLFESFDSDALVDTVKETAKQGKERGSKTVSQKKGKKGKEASSDLPMANSRSNKLGRVAKGVQEEDPNVKLERPASSHSRSSSSLSKSSTETVTGGRTLRSRYPTPQELEINFISEDETFGKSDDGEQDEVKSGKSLPGKKHSRSSSRSSKLSSPRSKSPTPEETQTEPDLLSSGKQHTGMGRKVRNAKNKMSTPSPARARSRSISPSPSRGNADAGPGDTNNASRSKQRSPVEVEVRPISRGILAAATRVDVPEISGGVCCPMCSRQFYPAEIEAHAANCEGPARASPEFAASIAQVAPRVTPTTGYRLGGRFKRENPLTPQKPMKQYGQTRPLRVAQDTFDEFVIGDDKNDIETEDSETEWKPGARDKSSASDEESNGDEVGQVRRKRKKTPVKQRQPPAKRAKNIREPEEPPNTAPCPICNKAVLQNELEAHVNMCLDRQARGEPPEEEEIGIGLRTRHQGERGGFDAREPPRQRNKQPQLSWKSTLRQAVLSQSNVSDKNGSSAVPDLLQISEDSSSGSSGDFSSSDHTSEADSDVENQDQPVSRSMQGDSPFKAFSRISQLPGSHIDFKNQFRRTDPDLRLQRRGRGRGGGAGRGRGTKRKKSSSKKQRKKRKTKVDKSTKGTVQGNIKSAFSKAGPVVHFK